MTLREQMAADVAGVFLNDEEHAESVTYTPANGVARTITAIVNEDGGLEDQDGRLADRIYAWVFVARSGTTGIDDPQVNDTLAVTRGGEEVRFTYAGGVSDADDSGWWLRFSRQKNKRYGRNVDNR